MKWIYSIVSMLLILQIFEAAPAALSQSPIGVEMITAHRGSSHYAPENTLAALELAIEHHAGIAEIDVRMTSDGVLVLSHDANLLRTAGLNKYISKSTYKEIAGVDVGKRFHEEYQGETIPTLQEALDLADGRITLNIEIKMEAFNPQLTSAVADAIISNEAMDRTIVTSFMPSALAVIKDREPSIQTGLIINSPIQLTESVLSHPQFDILSIRSSLVNRHIVTQAKKSNKKVFVWTVNRADEMKRVASYGVDSIITDRPDLLFQALF